MSRWFHQWAYATTFSGIAGAIIHAWSPIEWWTTGYTLTWTSLILVASIGAAWATADYIWRRGPGPAVANLATGPSWIGQLISAARRPSAMEIHHMAS